MYIKHLATSTNVKMPTPLSCLVTAYSSLAKTGTVSDRFIQKVQNDVNNDLNEAIVLRSGQIRQVYNIMKHYVDETNAGAIFSTWDDMIPEMAMPIKLTLTQTIGHGMTAFVTIGRAFIAYPDFYWESLKKEFGSEFNNFNDAVTRVLVIHIMDLLRLTTLHV